MMSSMKTLNIDWDAYQQQIRKELSLEPELNIENKLNNEAFYSKVFSQIDTNNDNSISKDELFEFLCNLHNKA